MYTNKTARLFLTSILLVSIGFSSLVVSSVQADTSPTVTLSPAIVAKLDAFIVKVQALRSKYPSDTDWNTFLTNLNTKIGALKPKYTGNALILAVLDRLSSGVNGLKNTATSAIFPDDVDLCAQEGLDNIDETNFNPDINVHTGDKKFMGYTYDWRNFSYKMGPWQSYSFPIDTFPLNAGPVLSNGLQDPTPRPGSSYILLSGNDYINSPFSIYNISEKKCDFVKDTKKNCLIVGQSGMNVIEGRGGDINVNAKFADPNYVPSADEASHCMLLPNKKYYVNIRWLRKSDIVDTAGNLKDDYRSMFSFPIELLSGKPDGKTDAKIYWKGIFLSSIGVTDSMTKIQLNNKFDEIFNIKGDACLDPKACLIDPFNNPGNFIIPMPKLTPSGQAARIAEQQRYNTITQQNQDEATRQREAQCKLVGHYPNGNPCM